MTPRRHFLELLAASVLGLPGHAQAQQGAKVWRVGFLALSSRPASLESHFFGAFPRAMRDLGYVEGRSLALEWRFAEGRAERLPELAAELLAQRVDAIVASASAAALAAQKATTTTPIVFAAVNDPVRLGLVKSLARPGGNVTGFANITHDLGPKRLELLLTLLPRLARVAVLTVGGNPGQAGTSDDLQALAHRRHVTIIPLAASDSKEIEAAFAAMARDKVGALIAPLTPLFSQQRAQIAQLAARQRLPVVAGDRAFAEAGCLMSYGASLSDDFRRVAGVLDRIFKGTAPADLPVQQPTVIELVINAGVARSMGLVIPSELRLRADTVIE